VRSPPPPPPPPHCQLPPPPPPPPRAHQTHLVLCGCRYVHATVEHAWQQIYNHGRLWQFSCQTLERYSRPRLQVFKLLSPIACRTCIAHTRLPETQRGPHQALTSTSTDAGGLTPSNVGARLQTADQPIRGEGSPTVPALQPQALYIPGFLQQTCKKNVGNVPNNTRATLELPVQFGYSFSAVQHLLNSAKHYVD
jgi:hypothetical protein